MVHFQLAAGVKREQETTDENKKLRGGLTDALVKIDHYKKEAERMKETCQEMAEQLGMNEERIVGLSHFLNANIASNVEMYFSRVSWRRK